MLLSEKTGRTSGGKWPRTIVAIQINHRLVGDDGGSHWVRREIAAEGKVDPKPNWIADAGHQNA